MNKIESSSLIGYLFLAAFPAFGIGQYLLERDEVGWTKLTGVILISLNTLIVILIGLYLNKTLKKFNNRVSFVYITARMIEGFLLICMMMSSLKIIDFIQSSDFYNYAMLSLGLGSIPVCWMFFRKHITPDWVAIWGLTGYVLFSFGFILEIFNISWSIYFLIPGGLWELFFGVWLILYGKKLPKNTTI